MKEINTVGDLKRFLSRIPDNVNLGTFHQNTYIYLSRAAYIECNKYIDLKFSEKTTHSGGTRIRNKSSKPIEEL